MPALRYAVVALAVLAMLWPSAPPDARSGLAGSEWRVVEIAGTKLPGEATLRFTQTSVRGRAPCNAFFGAFRETAGRIDIGGINETRVYCSGRMEVERIFLEGLARARSYRVDQGAIMLLDADGRALARLES